MAREETKMILHRGDERHNALLVWTVSKGRDTYGYNICTAFVDGVKVGSCNGGGYDMQGVALSGWVASKVAPDAEFYGLSWHDPNYKTPKKVDEAEQAGESFGLERYQEFYKASSPKRTDRHTIPIVDGACGLDTILNGIGFKSWTVSEHTTQEVKDWFKRYSTYEDTKGKDWETVARENGFRKTGSGRKIWERWPVEKSQ